METKYWLVCVGSAVAVLLVAGVRDIWRLMTWKVEPNKVPSRLGAVVFYLAGAVLAVIIIVIWIGLILTGMCKGDDRDDDHLHYMPSR